VIWFLVLKAEIAKHKKQEPNKSEIPISKFEK